MVDRTGEQFGNYILKKLIGQGGLADVYLAEHEHLGTEVAIKILNDPSITQKQKDDFKKEAQLVVKLQHPNIVKVLDFGIRKPDDIPYLVMPYLPNSDLETLHPTGTPLPIPTVISYIKQISSALQYAHDANMLHLDIKAENVLFDNNNTLLLTDFGNAAIIQGTITSVLQPPFGTPEYMAPEQFLRKAGKKSDQYSLAILAYRLLSGDVPFHANTQAEFYKKHSTEMPPPLTQPDITPEIEQVILTALEVDPNNRYPSVQGFSDALEQAATQAPKVVVKPAPQPQPIQPNQNIHAPIQVPPKNRPNPPNFNKPQGKNILLPLTRKSRLLTTCVIILLALLLVFGTLQLIAWLKSSITIGSGRGSTYFLTVSSTGEKTVRVSGIAYTPGTRATGQLTFLDTTPLNISFGSVVLRGASGVPITFNGPITVPANPGFLDVTGFAVNVGPAGNIEALDITGSCCAAGITVKNYAFSGGQDPLSYSVVKQSDIDGAVHSLETTENQIIQQSLPNKIHSNERLINSPKCTYTYTSDHVVNDRATTVTITLTSKCLQEVAIVKIVSQKATPTATATPGMTPSATPTAVPFQVTTINLTVDPLSIAGQSCGTQLTVTYTATFNVLAKGPGGAIQFTYTTDEGRTTKTGVVQLSPGETSMKFQFPSSGTLELNGAFPGAGQVTTTSPNTVSSQAVTPSDACTPATPTP